MKLKIKTNSAEELSYLKLLAKEFCSFQVRECKYGKKLENNMIEVSFLNNSDYSDYINKIENDKIGKIFNSGCLA